jgi:hypothetical protein
MIKTDKRTIHVELLEEGTPCWRLVEAQYLGSELCRITSDKPDDEVGAFSAGGVVKCIMKKFQAGSPELVAYEKIANERTH